MSRTLIYMSRAQLLRQANATARGHELLYTATHCTWECVHCNSLNQIHKFSVLQMQCVAVCCSVLMCAAMYGRGNYSHICYCLHTCKLI